MSVEPKPMDAAVETITVTIDGIETEVPKGTLAIRAAEQLGIIIPRFCDHPLLDPVGACRQCLVEVPDAGNGRGFPTPQAACTLSVAPGMQIQTQHTSEVARAAQAGVQELMLINHPLDCPVCDKGGECPLQNQAFAQGQTHSRYEGVKRTYRKPVAISPQILLDRERCVLCARCTRFSDQISGDQLIAMTERGAKQQVGNFADEPYNSYFSGNVVQLCPVGALTASSYRFSSRPNDLVSTDTTCEHCAAGCQLRTDHRHYQTRRRLAGNAPEVNEEWICDKGRFAFSSAGATRLATPLVRIDGELQPASWPEAIDAAVAGLKAAGNSIGVLVGGRLSVENAYAYSKFARVALGTNDIDFRSRPASDEEAEFLAAKVAGIKLENSVTYSDFANAKQVILVCFEPEDEAPIVFLRLRKAVRKNKLQVVTIAAFASRGSAKLGAELRSAAPGDEAKALEELKLDADTIILVGERAATAPGVLKAVVESGARWAWIPRRAGEIGALEAGCLPGLLPGGRPVIDDAARAEVGAVWGVEPPAAAGKAANEMLMSAPKALLISGLEFKDFADANLAAFESGSVEFVISLDSADSTVARYADVVFPVALIEEQSGHFFNWEHRAGVVNQVNTQAKQTMTELRVLGAFADALEKPLGLATAAKAWDELHKLGVWEGVRPDLSDAPVETGGDGYRLATWRMLIDNSASIAANSSLAQTAPKPVARISPATAAKLNLSSGDKVEIGGTNGEVQLPVAITDDLRDDSVWIPSNSGALSVGELGLSHGCYVPLSPGGANDE